MHEFLRIFFFQDDFPTILLVIFFQLKTNLRRRPSDPELCFPKKSVFVPNLSFQIFCSIGSLLKFQEQSPIDLWSSIVYLFECSQCEAAYVGETTRHLNTRVAVHKRVSSRIDRRLSQPPKSWLREHAAENSHGLVFNKFSILSKCAGQQRVN